MTSYWVSCKQFTCLVRAEDGKIIEAAPMVRRFIGQPLHKLLDWAVGLGALRVEILPEAGVRRRG